MDYTVKNQCTLTAIRTYQNLLPDTIVARVRQAISPTSAMMAVAFTPGSQTSSPSYGRMAQGDDSLPKAQTRHAHAYGQWAVSTFMGTIKYSKRCYSTIKRSGSNECRKTEVDEEVIVQYQGPAWLIGRAWEIQASRAVLGWTFQPRIFNVIPSSSLLFQCAVRGYTEEVNTLQQKRSFPF